MGDVEITAENDFALFAPQLSKVRNERFQEPEFRRLPMRTRRSRRQVYADHGPSCEIGLQVATFGVEFGMPEAVAKCRRVLGIDGDAGVPLALRGMKCSDTLPWRAQ